MATNDSQQPLVSFIVPALNEELNLPQLFERLLSLEDGIGLPIEILVIDDFSDDGTLGVAQEAGRSHPQIRSLRKPLPHGIGRAIRAGLEIARGKVGVVVMADGVDPLEKAVPDFCRMILEDGCHLVLLSRYIDRGDSRTIPLSYKLYHLLFRLLTSRCLGIPYRDTTYAFRAFDLDFVRNLGLRSDGFEISPELTIKTFFSGGRIGEVPGYQTRRVRGKSKFLFSKVMRGYAMALIEGMKLRLGGINTKSVSSMDSGNNLVIQKGSRPLAAIHLDLDGGAHVYRAHEWKYEADDDPLFETGLRRALDFFGRAGVRATLFVIAEDLNDPRKRELLTEAVREGHEIASHSLTHRRLTAITREEKRREIIESRERLTHELGVVVDGFRAPGFALDREALEMIAEAGYAYDSSLFPTSGLARAIGAGHLSVSPHRPLPGYALVELPMPAHRPLPLPFHPSYSLALGMWYFRLGLRLFRRMGAPLALLFHLTDFADPLPEAYLPNTLAKFYTLSHLSAEAKLRRCEWMLEMVRREYQLVSTAELLDQTAMTPHTAKGVPI